MASWTAHHSRIFSQLLDKVVGTPDMIAIRQDFCRLLDCIYSIHGLNNNYFTGSKAEGLDLPGSDEDYMCDINDMFHLKVIQSLDESTDIFPNSIFLMSTDNVPLGFALLQHVHKSTAMHPFLYSASQRRYGSRYVSSDLLAQNYLTLKRNKLQEGEKLERQGPSVERWSLYDDKSGQGNDNVPSIYCNFWPNEAAEWTHRSRNFDWPTSFDILSIIEFGFHLVPVGHPLSDMKSMQWRISFSMAERALVWSFNHVQMQCYAIMKIILKEFIKVRCNPQNQILCSYFIKTFLFWKYEATKLNFWRADNLRECIKYLLSEFSQCVREGVLRHYFIPRFNLLSIKLTRAAQIELLQLFDIINERDITILKECKTLKNIWSEFLKVWENPDNIASNLKRRSIVMNDVCMKFILTFISTNTEMIQVSAFWPVLSSFKEIIQKILPVFCKTSLKTLMVRNCLFMHNLSLIKNSCGSGNKSDYQIHQVAQNNTLFSDISTCKLQCAILFYMKGDCLSTLNIVNQVLSSIPPYAIYMKRSSNEHDESTQLYVDMFLDSDTTVIQRARKAWLLDFLLTMDMIDSELIPIGIKIELYFSNMVVIFSPFTCAYYLQFLCYHDMHQYDRRDRALLQLIEVANNPEQCGEAFATWNLAGHCLLLAGKRDQARDMFYRSYTESQRFPPYDKYNSALWYLQNYF